MKPSQQNAAHQSDIDWVMIFAAILSIGLGIGIAAASMAAPVEAAPQAAVSMPARQGD